MFNKSFSLMLGITLLMSGFPKDILAYPVQIRTNPYSGIHRTIIAPNTQPSRSYYRGNSYYGGGGNSYSRERIIIERNQRGYCGNCDYPNHSYPSQYNRGYQRYYNPNRSNISPGNNYPGYD
ncbi:hypothetical protein VB715_16945 [Crocosphaera sp. UHCC 0190]|uniref:hypothetical protein n=1 Tax=Crocosphaera sp. UHCC 0190 TaxID=3110246 RepID=UPI002B20F263|nr:hypothetical protein [Crocosphaera sp. UHCC 0190]MEA5511462.1 hypothetical protein [Crocosphaera sp. UHCC 0190]